jgi:hypothetical protein
MDRLRRIAEDSELRTSIHHRHPNLKSQIIIRIQKKWASSEKIACFVRMKKRPLYKSAAVLHYQNPNRVIVASSRNLPPC